MLLTTENLSTPDIRHNSDAGALAIVHSPATAVLGLHSAKDSRAQAYLPGCISMLSALQICLVQAPSCWGVSAHALIV